MVAVRIDIAGLPTQEFLEKAISNVADRFNDNFKDKNRKIESLKERLYIIERGLPFWKLWNKRLDEQDQFSRKASLRIQNIPLPSTVSYADCVKKLMMFFRNLIMV